MSDAKLILLLATGLFLVSAPEPDSATIAEATARFIVPVNERALLASEAGDENQAGQEIAAPSPATSDAADAGTEEKTRLDDSVDAG